MVDIKTKKDLILDCICKMDLDMLNLVLDDSRKFMGYDKKEFLKKLDRVFDRFKEAGDSELLYRKGNCKNGDCPKRGCGGAAFVGNVSELHIDFVLTESPVDILDMCWCENFRTYCEYQPDRNKKLEFNPLEDMSEDEFRKYLMMFVNTQEAMQELITEKAPRFLETKLSAAWLEKHKNLFSEILNTKHRHVHLSDFTALYNELDRLSYFLTQEHTAKEAIADYNNLDMNNEQQFLNWIVKYETLGVHVIESGDCIFRNITGPYPGYTKLHNRFELYISAFEFANMAAFKEIIHRHYWKTFDRYCTLSMDECMVMIRKLGDNCQELYLSYHLRARGLI